MTKPVAKKDDRVVGVDIHIVLISSPAGTIPTPMPSSFSGKLKSELSSTVFADDKAVATKGSKAKNSPSHVAMGGSFQKSPSNEGTITKGSSTVLADDKELARSTDPVECCNDPKDSATGHVIASGTVLAGD